METISTENLDLLHERFIVFELDNIKDHPILFPVVTDFEIDLRSPTVAIDSSEASVIQGSLTKKMKESEYILVIVGAKAYASNWMKWEIERAKQSDTNLKFAAVKIASGNTSPSGLPTSTVIATEFKLDKIVNALNNARRNS
jgi:hypothetical protein